MKLRKYFRACLMSMTMYCAIPMPYHKWDDESKPLMVACLPIVGLEIGALWAALTYLLQQLVGLGWFPKPLAAVLFAFFPYAISGFMHLDGFMDVVDAVKSYKGLSERRKILKDSNVGAFAVVAVAMLLIISFAAASCLTYTYENILILVLIPVMTRCLSALSVGVLPTLDTSQYSGAFKEGVTKGQKIFLIVVATATGIIGAVFCGFYALALIAVLLGYFCALMKAFHNLDGMNGDIAGYALTIAELAGVIMYALVRPLAHLWANFGIV